MAVSVDNSGVEDACISCSLLVIYEGQGLLVQPDYPMRGVDASLSCRCSGTTEKLQIMPMMSRAARGFTAFSPSPGNLKLLADTVG